MLYNNPPLVLTENSIRDANGKITLDDLPDPQPQYQVRLANTTPLIERLWRIALADIEKNIVQTDAGRYFGAGTAFGCSVYTRDISYSGILGLNKLYPDLMLESIRFTRKLRSDLKFRVSQGYRLEKIDAPWIEEELTEHFYYEKYHTNSYTRRTDDVVWLWCTADLLRGIGSKADWAWLYETGQTFFRQFYEPFFDPQDGLYFGQASFIDIHFVDEKATGYPQDWNIEDCVMVKSLSTNCLYVLGLQAMRDAAARLNLEAEADGWDQQCTQLKAAIHRELRHKDGQFTYLKDSQGNLQNRRDALGCALAVLSGVAVGEAAAMVLKDYPLTDGGAPLFHPFFPQENWYHNNSSWPFVDTFLIKALEMTDGVDRTALNAALLARTCILDGTFHEVTDYRTREIKGSGSQLWTAIAFVDTCRRAGLVGV